VELKDLSFGQWLKYVFDHDDRDWHFQDDAPYWNENAHPALTLQYVTCLFENIHSATHAYSDAQIAHGLWFLASTACSSHLLCLFDGRVAWAQRERGFNALYLLFARLFAKRCTPHLSHLDRTETPPHVNPLNLICYMWWDLDWIYPAKEDAARQQASLLALNIMQQSLALPSPACQESALHGLGHWHYVFPKEVETIIAAFLKRETMLSAELKAYALSARGGCVL
jgi:hypothetical protein